MKSIISARASRPFSWGAVFAGVAVGAVASMAVLAVGAFITFLFGLSFSLTGFMGLFWFAVSALVGAFVAGNIAVNAQAPVKDDDLSYQAVSKAHATLTGGVTAALLVLFTTFFTITGISSVVGATASVAGSVGSAVGHVVSGTAQSAAKLGANSDFSLDNLPSIQEKLGQINQDDLAKVISNNNDQLDEAQVKAIGNVVAETLKESQQEVKGDIKQINLDNAGDYLKARFEAAKDKLTDDELVARLQRQGLTRDEAVEVQQYLLAEAEKVEQKAEQAVTEAKKALDEAESAARSAARWAALSWLISAFLTFFATLLGARTAASRLRD